MNTLCKLSVILKRALNDGLEINYAKAQPTNTHDAHRLANFAKINHGNKIANEIIDELFRAYFVDGKKL